MSSKASTGFAGALMCSAKSGDESMSIMSGVPLAQWTTASGKVFKGATCVTVNMGFPNR